MAETSSAPKLTESIKVEGNHSPVICNFPATKPRHKPLTSPIVTSKEIAKELLERAEKRQRSYPDGVDVLLAMKQSSSPLKTQRKEDGKLDANELLSILQDGAEVHYVDKPKPNKVPRLSRGPYKDLKIDPELEKRLALQQLMEFSRKRGRPKKSETESNNNNNINNNNKGQGSSDAKQTKKNAIIKEVKTPNRELRKLLQDEGAINMLYAIEKGESENKEKLLPSKRRMKKAFIRKAQEVTEALLCGATSSGVSLRHRSISEKRKPSTDSVDSEQSEFQFTPPSDSKIIRRHSSSSSYSSRASSPRMSSPPLVRPDDGIRISERTEQLIEAKCKELNLQPGHSQIIKKLIQEKQNGFKERLQSEFANKLRAAINRNESSIPSSSEKTSIWKMVEEDWGSGSDSEADQNRPKENGGEEPNSTPNKVKTSSLTSPPPPPKPQELSESREERVNEILEEPKDGTKEDFKEKRLPRELSSYREIKMIVSDGLASLSLATNSTILPHALSTKVLRELSLALEYVSQSTDVKCITLMSDSLDFCLGFDLPGLLSRDQGERRALAAQAALAIKEFACKVCMLGKPLIAGVRGRAIGLGTVLLCYCDMVLAEPGCTFSTPYPRLGCFPEAAATTLLPHVIGLAQAKKLLLTCARLSGTEAESCGLVTRLVSQGELKRELLAAGKDILTHSPQVMASTKAVVMHGLRTKLPSVLETEVKLLQQHWTSEDCQKRIASLADNPDSI
ncbi:uncharacterized protein [Halyomorpha halys]|uniref:uncharacterized protein n=1 Tax=Halyomorpha halys TaxID=286706 RepID=UPI0006D51FAC|nr:uncharacterized protein LOC106682792 [Halyomorpha halys]